MNGRGREALQEDKSKTYDSPIPKWMLAHGNAEGHKVRGMNISFLRNTLTGISQVIQNDLLSERFASKNGLLQNIDPRVKFFSLLLFIVITGVTGKFSSLILLIMVSAFWVKLSVLDFTAFIKRVWLVIPPIILIFSIPAATSIFIQGKPLFYLYHHLNFKIGFVKFPDQVYFSWEGILTIIKMALRVGLSFSFGYVLIMTTRWSEITKSLRVLKIPKLIITILDMTYRYIFVLARISIEIFEARFLRTVGNIKNKDNRKFISNGMAFLFVKSSFMSEEIYHSMMCRGYVGDPVSVSDFKLSGNDLIWMVNVFVILTVLMIL